MIRLPWQILHDLWSAANLLRHSHYVYAAIIAQDLVFVKSHAGPSRRRVRGKTKGFTIVEQDIDFINISLDKNDISWYNSSQESRVLVSLFRV